jgi:hypothetical protein
MEEMRNSYKCVVRKPEGKRPFRRLTVNLDGRII